ncbi:type 4a pilus biogenesis protein PilO [Euzebya rosea]|uniref:type 4a pilus biogenesis protein PilO n=1 Tax=Euzebya rosea TaxID=2052804 RepID=UPI000D3E4091|nr:type 4a pilus biogenesis protein PilO [Euzebya rosea]
MTRVWLSVLAAAVVLTVAWWFLFYGPARTQQQALQAETATLVTQQGQLRTQIAQLRDIREQEVQIQADLARLEQYIPVNPSQASLVRQVQLAADASGLTVESLTFADPVVVEGAPPPAQPGLVLGRIETEIVLEGGYFQAADFLRRLEVEVARAMLVQQIGLEESEDGFPRLSSTIRGSIFALIVAPVDPNAPVIDPNAPVEGTTEAPEGDDAPAESDEISMVDGDQVAVAMGGTR